MTIENLSIPDAWVFTPKVFGDDRGIFFEWFQKEAYEKNRFDLAQANCSISKKGTLRGIHFALMPPGQRKHVTCFNGRALDVLVDLRKGSPTFSKWVAIELNTESRKVISIPNGVGHAFLALEDHTILSYLCDQRYNPANEKEIYPLDPEIDIKWPTVGELLLSPKDEAAPTLSEMLSQLPEYVISET